MFSLANRMKLEVNRNCTGLLGGAYCFEFIPIYSLECSNKFSMRFLYSWSIIKTRLLHEQVNMREKQAVPRLKNLKSIF